MVQGFDRAVASHLQVDQYAFGEYAPDWKFTHHDVTVCAAVQTDLAGGGGSDERETTVFNCFVVAAFLVALA